MQVEIVEHKNPGKYEILFTCFFLPKDEFRRKYLTSIKQPVTHLKIKDTRLALYYVRV